MAEEIAKRKDREWFINHKGTMGITTTSQTTFYHNFRCSQTTVSVNHGGPPRPGSAGDIGGSFFTTKREYSEVTPYISASAGSAKDGIRFYNGPQFAYTGNGSLSDFPLVNPSSDDELDAMGTKAIAAVLPTNPSGSMITTLAELKREGVPSLLGAKSRHDLARSRNYSRFYGKKELIRDTPEALASDYLSYEFGWKPLLSELQAFARSVKDSERIIHQYRKDSGKKIKRSFSFPGEKTVNTVVVAPLRYPTPVLDTYLYGPTGDTYQRGPLTATTSIERKVWFEGAFRYYVPVGDDMVSKFSRFSKEADRLLGVTPSPEVVYNLTPWSWAFDWVGNMDSIMSNASAFLLDGLVMQYGYVMETKETKTEYALTPRGGSYSRQFGATGTTGRTSGQASVPASQCFTTTVKTRRRATPYGFGLDWEGFSPRQLAILAALGITRSAPAYQ